MAHSLSPRSAPAASPPPCPARKHRLSPPTTVALDRLGWRGQEEERATLAILRHRRTFISGLVGAGFGAALNVREAGAAARRPPPPTEKKDPNVSGVQEKVRASKKRKEAMKEAMAELRRRGKPVEEAAPAGGEAVAGEPPVGEPPR